MQNRDSLERRFSIRSEASRSSVEGLEKKTSISPFFKEVKTVVDILPDLEHLAASVEEDPSLNKNRRGLFGCFWRKRYPIPYLVETIPHCYVRRKKNDQRTSELENENTALREKYSELLSRFHGEMWECSEAYWKCTKRIDECLSGYEVLMAQLAALTGPAGSIVSSEYLENRARSLAEDLASSQNILRSAKKDLDRASASVLGYGRILFDSGRFSETSEGDKTETGALTIEKNCRKISGCLDVLYKDPSRTPIWPFDSIEDRCGRPAGTLIRVGSLDPDEFKEDLKQTICNKRSLDRKLDEIKKSQENMFKQ